MIPQNLAELISLAEDAADGALAHGAAISLAQNTEAKIRTDLKLLIGDFTAVPPTLGSVAIYAVAKSAKTDATSTRNAIEAQARDQISACIGVLKPRIGKQWNSEWVAAGFPSGSLAVPQDSLPMLISLKNYFIGHPAYEIPALGADAASLDATSIQVSDTRSAVNEKETQLASAKETRDGNKETLYHRMTGLRSELTQLLRQDDPVWYAFGFSRPADGDGPGPISTLTLNAVGPGVLLASWSHAIRAVRYRVFRKILGTDAVPVQIATDVEGLSFTLLGLPSAVTVEVYIVPVNPAGDGPHSPTVSATVA